MKVTIFIRARNEGASIRRCLEMVFSQKAACEIQVILLDCESTDQTVDAARKFAVEIYQIPPQCFTYASALNFGVSRAEGDYFISLSAHAFPENGDWLGRLIAPLDDQTVAASFSRQVCDPEQASAPERKMLATVFGETDWILQESRRLPLFSNVSSCIRTAIAREIPFREVPFSEDRLFGAEVLKKGYRIAYAAASRVFHLHAPSLKENYTIARKAAIAQGRSMAYLGERRGGFREIGRLAANFGKICVFPLWVAVVLSGKGLLWSGCERKRERRFYLAAVGTTAGKLIGTLELLHTGARPPSPASTELPGVRRIA